MAKIRQTAGHEIRGDFAPQFATLNDDVLFGEVWSDDTLSQKTRSIITISTLVGKGMVGPALGGHLETARKNGVTRREMAAMLTQLAFYAGWPNAWGTFAEALKIYGNDPAGGDSPESHGGVFGLGQANDMLSKYFTGTSYVNPLTNPKDTQFVANVTFEPGCRNNWHVHKADEGGGQILLCTDGRGWVQLEGEDAVELSPGTAFFVPANTKHWHGAAKDSWMSHIAFCPDGTNASTEWLEAVDDDWYDKLS
ncbi:carboxymuconolactone decarboxylase family protein [Bifidobacterium eulemuris]|uniref:Carboxymuconolactone decarboxylase family protein n=1 Tax=Bifidobacterium eulemuris TaxID=1765219 RepID=A0A261GCB5_9BIFI|nr:carboxymuconolactone decarboxylase family protein [Bifidobacterium eulemuris]OZG69060.1 gamma-carboxymuconolactone decarboxylase [Bifidobacterium eulemuris]QOL31414.1 carboxymuconolactone decarboxylase family protein [Bifidobacterium eulemuris]